MKGVTNLKPAEDNFAFLTVEWFLLGGLVGEGGDQKLLESREDFFPELAHNKRHGAGGEGLV